MQQAILAIFFLLLPTMAYQQNYNFYRGNIHSHTAYSDGNKEGDTAFDTPLESYDYAKNALKFDFLGISEHNHSGAGMTLSNYQQGIEEADSATDASFVGLYGMEWGTISGGGHVVIYGVDSLIGWEPGNYDIYNAKTDYTGLFKKIAARSGAFAYLAHPDKDDFDSIFHKSYNSEFDAAVIGVAVRSGPAFSEDTTYSDPSSSSYYARYKDALGLGYQLAPGIDHDNHYTTFGKTTPARLVVLAESLTRENLLDALQSSRFYASDDWNVEVNFTVNSGDYYMGEKVADRSDPSFEVTVYDPDPTDSIKYIRLKHGIPGSGSNPTSVATANDDTALTYTHSINDGDSYYYYLEIRQYDDDMIYTAPVIYSKNVALPIELLYFDAQSKGGNVELNWETASEINNDFFTPERSGNGSEFVSLEKTEGAGNSNQPIKYSYLDDSAPAGLLYYRLKQTDYNGKSAYSDLLAVNNVTANEGFDVTLTDIDRNRKEIEITSATSEITVLKIYNTLGEVVLNKNLSVTKGITKTTFSTGSFVNGLFLLTLQDPQGKILFSDKLLK